MCGISAIISKRHDVYRAELSQITSVVNHRGPDGSGTWVNTDENRSAWIGLGHTRLSIIDLSNTSDQPFLSRDGRFALTFNGEIYNFVELRNQLVKLGHQFRSSGDTEVLLAALIEWGIDALPRLRGMFAFVFVDLVARSVLAARDEFGIKPLYKCVHNQTVYFASEIKQFSAITNRRNQLNSSSAVDFLLFGITDHSRDTHFQGIEHVLPGEYVLLDGANGFQEQRFSWRKKDYEIFQGSYGEAKDEYRRLLLESVDLHLRSDVEIGSCLSGGLDSSAIVGIVHGKTQGMHAGQHTFTATSEDKSIDETRFAEAVVAQTNAIPHYIQPSAAQLWQDIEQLSWHQDEPFGSTSIYAQWSVFEEAKNQGIKVMLDGQGADEQLGGYNSFINTHLREELRQCDIARFRRDFLSYKASGRVTPLSFSQYLAYSLFNQKLVKFLGSRLGVASQNHLGWVDNSLVKSINPSDPYRIQGKVPRTVRELSTEMVFRSNLPMLLRFEDRNSMAHGVEARVPFVDGPLMHFTLSLPAQYLMAGELTKPLLRDAVGDFLPPLVLNRRDKIGFQTAEQTWFASNQQRVNSLVEEAISRLPSLFGTGTKKKVMSVLSGKEQFNNIPWRVMSMFFWAKSHEVES